MEIKNNILLSVDESDVDIDGKINIPERVTELQCMLFNLLTQNFLKKSLSLKV